MSTAYTANAVPSRFPPNNNRIVTGHGRRRQREAGLYSAGRRGLGGALSLYEARAALKGGWIHDRQAKWFFQDLAKLGRDNAGAFSEFWPGF